MYTISGSTVIITDDRKKSAKKVANHYLVALISKIRSQNHYKLGMLALYCFTKITTFSFYAEAATKSCFSLKKFWYLCLKSMHNAPKWSDTLQKSYGKWCKIFKVCLTILEDCVLEGYKISMKKLIF